VFFPGEYSIVEKKSRLSEVIKMAGGFTAEANLADAEIVRTTEEEVADPEYERLKTIPVADMTDMEYEYFKTKSREKAFVVVDFEALFLKGDKSQDILLRDNDAINIPIQAKTVRVSGQVVNPGLLNWEQGQNYLFYVERAGGFSYNAQKSRIRVIRASTGSWLKPDKKTIINLGDTIFVPEKPERDYWEIYKDIILVVSQMATIIILIRTVTL
jgi:protein involved in polysaccharide export with SLBB domain